LPPLDNNADAEDCVVLVIPADVSVERINGVNRGWLFSTWDVGYWAKLLEMFGCGSKAATLLVPAGEHILACKYVDMLTGRSVDNVKIVAQMDAGQMYMLSVTLDEAADDNVFLSIIHLAASYIRNNMIPEEVLYFFKWLPRAKQKDAVCLIDEVDQDEFDRYLLDRKGYIKKALLVFLVYILWAIIIGALRMLWYFAFMGKFMNRQLFAAKIFSIGLIVASIFIVNYNVNGDFSLYLLLTLLLSIGLSGWGLMGKHGKFNQKGIVSVNNSNHTSAISDFNKAIKWAPYNASYRNNRGIAYCHLQDWEKAVADFTKAIELKPFAEYYNHRGAAYCNLQRWEKAIDDFDNGMRLKLKGNIIKQVIDATTTVELAGEADYINLRGFAYFNLRNWMKAVDDFKEAVRLDPKNETYNKNLANAQEMLGKESAAYPTADQTKSGYFTDNRDGQRYRIVQIGNLVWMAENLNYKIDNSWCYDYNDANGKKYGRIYTWDAAMAAPPAGWRLPTRSDWDNLETAVGYGRCSVKLKTVSGWNKDDRGNNGNGTDDYGFSALPGGCRYIDRSDGDFGGIGEYGNWWTASEGEKGYAHRRDIRCEYSGAMLDQIRSKDFGASVRCVMG